MSEKFYRFIPSKADFETIRYKDADWATSDDFPGKERLCMLIVGHELLNGEYISFHYYETKERAILAAQEEIKKHIQKLESFLLKEAV